VTAAAAEPHALGEQVVMLPAQAAVNLAQQVKQGFHDMREKSTVPRVAAAVVSD